MKRDRTGALLAKLVERLERDLTALFGPGAFERWSEGALVSVVGGTVIFVVVSPFDDDAVVNVRTYLARRPDTVDGSLALHLVRLNAECLFGGFSIDDDGDVCFDHSLLASAATREALRAAVRSVVDAAERHAGEVLARWGGLSSLEMLRRRIEETEEEGPEEDLAGPVGPN